MPMILPKSNFVYGQKKELDLAIGNSSSRTTDEFIFIREIKEVATHYLQIFDRLT